MHRQCTASGALHSWAPRACNAPAVAAAARHTAPSPSRLYLAPSHLHPAPLVLPGWLAWQAAQAKAAEAQLQAQVKKLKQQLAAEGARLKAAQAQKEAATKVRPAVAAAAARRRHALHAHA